MGRKVSPKAYNEVKTKVTLGLTLTAVKFLDQQAAALNLSRSELVERFARGQISSTVESQFLEEFCAN